MEDKSIPYFACVLVQGTSIVYVPIPFGALENVSRILLSNYPDTVLEVRGIGMLKL